MPSNKQYDVKACLKDIELSINEIYEYLPDNRNFFDFQKDLRTRRLVERNIEIIGEAVDRILKINPNYPISDSRKIVDTRNRIIHGYDSVSENVLWLIVNRHLPILEKEVKILLQTS